MDPDERDRRELPDGRRRRALRARLWRNRAGVPAEIIERGARHARSGIVGPGNAGWKPDRACEFDPTGPTVAASYFLDIPGVAGDSTAEAHIGSIDASSMSWGLTSGFNSAAASFSRPSWLTRQSARPRRFCSRQPRPAQSIRLSRFRPQRCRPVF